MAHSRCFALPNPARLMRCFLYTAYGHVLVRFSTGQVSCLLGLKEVWVCAEGWGAKEGLPLVGVGLLKANTLMNQQWHLINV